MEIEKPLANHIGEALLLIVAILRPNFDKKKVPKRINVKIKQNLINFMSNPVVKSVYRFYLTKG